MILNRLGNKSKLAKKIIQFFPEHDMYLEPFFGTGSIFFSKPKVKYNFLNDLDNDVYNLFRQVIDNKDEFLEWFKRIPITETQFKEWRYENKREKTDVLNAVRFIVLSNFGLYGRPDTLRIGAVNSKEKIFQHIDKTFEYLQGTYFLNCDFREFFNRVDYKTNKEKCFCYADPPYYKTDSNYSNNFSEKDTLDLFDVLMQSGIRFMMSEYSNPFIIEEAKKRNLNILVIGERKNLRSKKEETEILISNFKNTKTLFNLI